MKILVTGANGQLGRSLQYTANQYQNIQLINTDIDNLDITDAKAVNLFFEQQKPDFIINCAAYTAVDKAETEQNAAFLINTLAPEIIAKAAQNQQAALIHISTDYVFDGTQHKPYLETDATNPLGVYGKTKKDGEDAVLQHCKRATVVRTSWLYSEFGNNFLKTMLRLSNERSSIQVVVDQAGTPTYAGDLATAIFMLILKNEFNQNVFHFSNQGTCSWYDFAHEIMRIAGRNTQILPIETHQYPTPAKRPHYSVLNKAAISKFLDYNIPHWTDSLRVCMGRLE